MNTTDDRDRSIDNLLRQSFKGNRGAAASGSSCLDAETIAAWADGSLGKSSLATVEMHLSECARCQGVAAVLTKMPATAPESRRSAWWQRGVDLRWLVPLVAGATAVAIWVAVPGREGPQQSAVGSQQSAVDGRQSAVDSRQSAVGSRQSAVDGRQSAVDSRQSTVVGQSGVKTLPAAPPEGPARDGTGEKALKTEKERVDAAPDRLDALSKDEGPRAPSANVGRLAEPVSAAPAPAASAAAPAARLRADARSESRSEAFAPARQASVIAQEVVSPMPLSRWRIGPRGLLQYSASGGAAWEQLSTDVVADLVAGASPSSTVCWVVGRAGTVLLTIDGRRFSRLPFPVSVDLTGVLATDAKSAVVTASDGRRFRTVDAGATWAP